MSKLSLPVTRNHADSRALIVTVLVLGASFPLGCAKDEPSDGTAVAESARLANRPSDPVEKARLELARQEKLLGTDHPGLVSYLGKLAWVLRHRDPPGSPIPPESEPILRRILAIQEKAFDPDHPRVADALIPLAYTYKGLAKPSEHLFKRALAIIDKAQAENHPELDSSLVSWAKAHRNTRRIGIELYKCQAEADEPTKNKARNGLRTLFPNYGASQVKEGSTTEEQ